MKYKRKKKTKLNQSLLFFPNLAELIILSCFCCVQGLDDEYQEEGKLLGHYTYQENGESLQSFPVMVTVKTFFFFYTRYMWSWCDDLLSI